MANLSNRGSSSDVFYPDNGRFTGFFEFVVMNCCCCVNESIIFATLNVRYANKKTQMANK